MKLLAISGSARAVSTNTAMLRAVAKIVEADHDVTVYSSIADLPVFLPDLEDALLPTKVQRLVSLIGGSDGIIIASPEYVRAIPGGLKNAIDWLVSRDEIIDKPVVLLHASHRGDDKLAQLRLVLSTVSQRFAQDLFHRFELMKLPPSEVSRRMESPSHRLTVIKFLQDFSQYCRQ